MAREDAKQERKWEPMRLTLLGKVGDVVRGGGGKLSTRPADPGEPRKPPAAQQPEGNLRRARCRPTRSRTSPRDLPRLRIEQGSPPDFHSFVADPSCEPHLDRSGRICAYTFVHEGVSWLYLPGLAYFRLWPGNGYVEAFPEPEASASTVAEAFYRIALPMALQAAGYEVLHASAVSDTTRVHVFCGASRSGKSTIAHALSNRGFRAWADDAVAFSADDGQATAIPLPFALRLRDDVADFFGVHRPSGHTERKDGGAARSGRSPTRDRVDLVARARARLERRPAVGPRGAPRSSLPLVLRLARDQAVRRRMSTQFLELIASVPLFRVSVRPALDTLDRLTRRPRAG